tara:strand:+ start:1914 stop:2459 length:546 start_codon:yes stop_codon:yes gene_type:complete
MKKIILNNKKDEKNVEKKREKIEKIKYHQDLSNCIINIINNYTIQIDLINKIYLEQDIREKKLIIREIKSKISSYRQQDIRKDLHEKKNLITLDDIIEKLVISKLKCYYCKTPLLIIFDKIRDQRQWTLDRLNNYDEHTNKNTIICCLKCNLERRRKNSDKFLFSKQLQTNQIKIKKIVNN